jgi:hypothetical protein
VEDYWASRHEPPFKPQLKALLEPRLQRYQLSATDVNTFTDVTTNGPEAFFIYSLLRFPKAQSIGASYGTAVHDTLRWYYQTASSEQPPALPLLLKQYEFYLIRQRLPVLEHGLFIERGILALTAWHKQRGKDITKDERYEYNFRNEASFVGQAHLTGKIDRMIIDSKAKKIKIIDFKSGQAHSRWINSNLRLHQYRQQLLIYKLLVENSKSFKGYSVEQGLLEFIEPDENGKIVQLELVYNKDELAKMKKLLEVIWEKIQNLDLPDVHNYPATIKGITSFEAALAG